MTREQGGRDSGPPPAPAIQDYAATGFGPPATADSGLASVVLRVSDRTTSCGLSAAQLRVSTRRYTITYRDGLRVDVDAEGLWPVFGALEFAVTVAVIGIPRQVVALRVMLCEVESVEREDGAVWSSE